MEGIVIRERLTGRRILVTSQRKDGSVRVYVKTEPLKGEEEETLKDIVFSPEELQALADHFAHVAKR